MTNFPTPFQMGLWEIYGEDGIHMANEKRERVRTSQIEDPTPKRKKYLIGVLYKFLQDKVSLAELRGMSRRDMYSLAESGYIKFKHGRLEEAENIFKSLMILDHRNAYFHSMMGAILQKQGRPVEAILEYDVAIRAKPDDVTCYVNRGEIYLRHNNYRKAAEDFKNAIVRDPIGTNLWANRARSLVIALKRQIERDMRKK